MALFVCDYLATNCSPQRNYNLPSNGAVLNERESLKKDWKKARVSDLSLSLQWEHFHELLEDTPYGSKERAIVIQEHFRSNGIPDTSYLSMFA